MERRPGAAAVEPEDRLRRRQAEPSNLGGEVDLHGLGRGARGASGEPLVRDPEQAGDVLAGDGLVVEEMVDQAPAGAGERAQGDHLLVGLDQRRHQEPALGRAIDLPPVNAPGELERLGGVRGQEILVDTEDAADARPGVEIAFPLLVREHQAETAQAHEHQARERHQRACQVLLVDGHAEILVPRVRRIVGEEVADGGVHEPDLLRAAHARSGRLEPTWGEHVDDHLHGFEDAPDRTLRHVARAVEHLHALLRHVAGRQRVEPQGDEDLRPAAREQGLRRGHRGGIEGR